MLRLRPSLLTRFSRRLVTSSSARPLLSQLPPRSSFSSSSSSDLSVVEIPMPALSPTMESGAVTAWKKKVGDAVSAGDALCEIETDKAVIDYDSQDDGFLAAVFVEEGTTDVPIGKLLAIMVEEEEDLEAAKTWKPPSSSSSDEASDKKEEKEERKTATESKQSQPQRSQPKQSQSKQSVFLPSVARLLALHSIDGASVEATGPKGHLLKGDVLRAIESGKFTKAEHKHTSNRPQSTATPASSTQQAEESSGPKPIKQRSRNDRSSVDIPNSNMRKVIASRLTFSKTTVPHAYAERTCALDALLQLRAQIKKRGDRPPSVNDFVIRASALALRDVPEANAIWDDKRGEVVLQESVDISVAVATDAGLITPIVQAAHHKSVGQISEDVRDLATRARNNKLLPHEFQGGSFTISNLGMFGITHFSAVINPPQACILAVGTSVPTAVERPKLARSAPAASAAASDDALPPPATDAELALALAKMDVKFSTSVPQHLLQQQQQSDDDVVAQSTGAETAASEPFADLHTVSNMTVTLSSDERVVDGEVAGRWLDRFQAYMENPHLLLS